MDPIKYSKEVKSILVTYIFPFYRLVVSVRSFFQIVFRLFQVSYPFIPLSSYIPGDQHSNLYSKSFSFLTLPNLVLQLEDSKFRTFMSSQFHKERSTDQLWGSSVPLFITLFISMVTLSTDLLYAKKNYWHSIIKVVNDILTLNVMIILVQKKLKHKVTNYKYPKGNL